MHPEGHWGSETFLYFDFFSDLSSYIIFVAIFITAFFVRKLDNGWLRLGYEKTEGLRKKNKFLSILFSHTTWRVLNAAAYILFFWAFGALHEIFDFLEDGRYFTLVNYFAVLYFGWIVDAPAMFLLGCDVRKSMDFITPFAALDLAICKIGCFCAGCCNGIAWNGGFYNYNTNRVEFPVQLLESMMAFLICAFLFYYVSKKKTDGKAYPIYMILYSGTRFLTEFLRDDFKANWLGMKPFQVLCLIGVLAGVVWLVIIRILDKKQKRLLYNTNLAEFWMKKKNVARS